MTAIIWSFYKELALVDEYLARSAGRWGFALSRGLPANDETIASIELRTSSGLQLNKIKIQNIHAKNTFLECLCCARLA